MTPMKPPRFGGYGYRRALVIVSIVTLLLAALVTTTRDDHGSTIAALPGATAQPSVPGGGSGGSGSNGGGPPFPMQPPAMPDAPAPYNGGSYPAPYQGNGIDINNPAQQPAQAPQQQPDFQQTNPQQLQPANGQQPPDYDAPLQSAQPQPQQQPQQQQSQQRLQQQEPQQQEQQDADQNQRNNQCEPNEFIPAQSPKGSDEEHAAFRQFADAARKALDDVMDVKPGFQRDHTIPLRRLWDITGFRDLPIEQQVAIANMPENLKYVPSRWNSSKGSRLWSETPPNPGLDPPLGPSDLAELCVDEKSATESVLKAVSDRLAQQPSSQIPNQTSTSPPHAPSNDQNAPQQAPQPATPLPAPSQPPVSQPPASPTEPGQPPNPRIPRRPPPSEPSQPPTAPPATQPGVEPSPAVPGWFEPVGAAATVIAGTVACVLLCAEAVAGAAVVLGTGALFGLASAG